jgi:hypothetical protein
MRSVTGRCARADAGRLIAQLGGDRADDRLGAGAGRVVALMQQSQPEAPGIAPHAFLATVANARVANFVAERLRGATRSCACKPIWAAATSEANPSRRQARRDPLILGDEEIDRVCCRKPLVPRVSRRLRAGGTAGEIVNGSPNESMKRSES